VAKRNLRCLKGVENYGILYKRGENEKLLAFIGNLEDRKSN